MAIVGQNSLLNQYTPTFYIKNIVDGQTVSYDSTKKAFVNSEGPGNGVDTVKTHQAIVPLSYDDRTAIGAMVPLGAIILSVSVLIIATDASALLSVGSVNDGVAAFMLTSENDPQNTGLYIADLYKAISINERINATVTSSSNTGGGYCEVSFTYRVPPPV